MTKQMASCGRLGERETERERETRRRLRRSPDARPMERNPSVPQEGRRRGSLMKCRHYRYRTKPTSAPADATQRATLLPANTRFLKSHCGTNARLLRSFSSSSSRTLTSLGDYRAFYFVRLRRNLRCEEDALLLLTCAIRFSETQATSARRKQNAVNWRAMANHLRLASYRLVSVGVAVIFNWGDRIGKIASTEYYGAFNLPPRCAS